MMELSRHSTSAPSRARTRGWLGLICQRAWRNWRRSTAPATQESRKELLEKAITAMTEMNREHPEAGAFASKGSGYAIFPEVTKGGLVFGGAYGRGVVYERGQHIGYADMRQGSFGLQAGGQTFSEVIVFENKAALIRRLDFAADASAVIVKTGAATNARFIDGVAVIVMPIAGAMAEASVGASSSHTCQMAVHQTRGLPGTWVTPFRPSDSSLITGGCLNPLRLRPRNPE